MGKDTILLYPSLNEELLSKIRFQKHKYKFFYTDADGEEYPLADEPVEAQSSVNCLKDKNGVWTQDDNNLCFRNRFCLRTFQCLFGNNGIACKDAKLGLAIQWTSSDSRQRGVICIGEFDVNDKILEKEIEYSFDKAQLRGVVNFTVVLYIAQAGKSDIDEKHLANANGYILGELDNYILMLDGNGSVFPVFEVSEPDQPLWYIKCDWIDPTVDSFSETVSINLNTAHKNYAYIDRTKKQYDNQLLLEIMSSAISLIIEKVRLTPEYWEQIMQGNDLEQGSVGHAIHYFMETLEWDLSSPEKVSISVRKFFDQRM